MTMVAGASFNQSCSRAAPAKFARWSPWNTGIKSLPCQDMERVLTATFGKPGSGKLDLNNTSRESLANRLREPLARAGVAMSEDQLQAVLGNLLDEMNTRHSGLITDFNQLGSVSGMNPDRK